MTYLLEFDARNQRLTLQVEEKLDFFSFRSAWLEFVVQNPGIRLQSSIWDLTRLNTEEILESDLSQMAHILAGVGPPMDLALVVPAKALAGLPLSYLGVLMDDLDNFRIFRTVDAGNRWLDARSGHPADDAQLKARKDSG